MHVPRAWRAHVTRSALSLCLAAAAAGAQHPPLAPTANTTIVVSSTSPLHYSSIHVPAGVTVRFVAAAFGPSFPAMPAVVLCDGDAIVHGTLSVAGDLMNGIGWPAGLVITGAGVSGQECTSQFYPFYSYSPPSGGSHAGVYGSVVPFTLEGGSPGGGLYRYIDLQFPVISPCGQLQSVSRGGAGGGTLALVAGGRIEVGGTVTADGYHNGVSGGSGGSILLRGHAGVSVLPGGTVTARGGTRVGSVFHPATFGAPGYVRLDAWGGPPVAQGTVAPAPIALELPYLHAASTPQIGSTWVLGVLAPENTPAFVAASVRAGPGTATPFGVLGIDLATAAGVALVVTQPGHDPTASVPWPVPNAPALIGLPLWVQAFAIPQTLPPRLTNTLAVVVS